MAVLENDITYQISLKKYFALMPYITHPETRDIRLDYTGIFWTNFEHKGFSDATLILREQIKILLKDILYVHGSDYSTAHHCLSSYRKGLFLSRIEAGLLRLNDESHYTFYKDGLLSLEITNCYKGILCINILENQRYFRYIKFSYHIGTLT